MAAPEQQVGKAQARAVDAVRAAAGRAPSSRKRIGLAVVPDQPHAAVAAQGRAAEVEARQPGVRPGQPARRLARTPQQLALVVQPEQPAVVADRARPAGQRQRAAGRTAAPGARSAPQRCTAPAAAGVVAQQAGERGAACCPARRPAAGQHGFGAVGFADRIDPQPAQAARGRHQRHFAAARLRCARQPAVVGRARSARSAAPSSGTITCHSFGQRIPVLQHAAARRQRQQALLGKAEVGGGEHAVGVRRRRHGRIEAADDRRGRPFFQAVAQRQRSDRQAVRHVARQQRRRHAGPTSRAGARGGRPGASSGLPQSGQKAKPSG